MYYLYVFFLKCNHIIRSKTKSTYCFGRIYIKVLYCIKNTRKH